MTFPVVEGAGTVHNTGGTPAASHVIDLPDNPDSGDLLFVSFNADGTGSHTWPGDWTMLAKVNSPGSSSTSYGYKESDGTETSMTITTSSENAVAHSLRVSGWDTATAPEDANATGDSATPDPPNLSPSWGAEDTLWIAVEGQNAGIVTGYPTNYDDNQATANTGGSGASSGSICTRDLNASSDDPGTFTTTSREWEAATIAVRPAAAEGRVWPLMLVRRPTPVHQLRI